MGPLCSFNGYGNARPQDLTPLMHLFFNLLALLIV